MEKYITSIKDLVIQVLTNGSEIKAKAESGDASSCFQMGMIHLLGIDTPIDFKKASKFFGNQSLSDDPDANRLLGFIAECEGNYSQAFKNYAKASGSKGSNAKKPYNNKVFSERNNLQAYFKKLELPSTILNKEITTILNDYIKGGDTIVDASIKLAMICDDKDTCVEAAQNLFKVGGFFTAKRILQSGKIDKEDPLFVKIDNKILESKKSFNFSGILEVIDIMNNSLLDDKSLLSAEEMRQLCGKAASSSRNLWQERAKEVIEPIIKEEEKIVKEKKVAKLAEKEIEDERKKKLKDKVSTYGGIIIIIILVVSGFYLYSNYSVLMATIIMIVIFLICGVVINFIEQKLGIDTVKD